MQRFQKGHQRGRFRWTEVFAVGGHISPTLNHLANKLIFREVESDSVERRPALTSFIIQRMTGVTLLGLENQRTITLQCCAAVEESSRNRHACPGVHQPGP